MRISLVTGLNNSSPVESCIRELTQARDEGFGRLWMTQMPYDVDLLSVLAAGYLKFPISKWPVAWCRSKTSIRRCLRNVP